MPDTQSDLKLTLDQVAVPPAVKSQVWKHFWTAPDQQSFQKGLDQFQLPDSAKHDIWNLRFPPDQKIDILKPATREVAVEPARLPVPAPVLSAEKPATPPPAAPVAPQPQVQTAPPPSSPGFLQAAKQNIGRFMSAMGNLQSAEMGGLPPMSTQDIIQKTSEAQEASDQPLVPVSKLAPEGKGPVKSFVRGVAKGVEGLTTPKNIGIGAGVVAASAAAPALLPAAAAAAAKAGISGYFAYEMAHGTTESVKSAYQKWQSGDVDGAAEDLGVSGVSGLMALGAAWHGAKHGKQAIVEARKPGAPPPGPPRAADAVTDIQATEPLPGTALRNTQPPPAPTGMMRGRRGGKEEIRPLPTVQPEAEMIPVPRETIAPVPETITPEVETKAPVIETVEQPAVVESAPAVSEAAPEILSGESTSPPRVTPEQDVQLTTRQIIDAPKAVGVRGQKAPWAQPWDVVKMPTEEIHTYPLDFQYKQEGIGQKGISDQFKDVTEWNPALGGTLGVWFDPRRQETVAINGHHRHDIATRVAEPDLNVLYVKAENIREARAIGAIMNIGDGKGTALDAAKVIRDMGWTPEQLKKSSIALTGKLARQGLALSRLPGDIFQRVVDGELDMDQAVAIAEAIPDEAKQRTVIDMLDKRQAVGGRKMNVGEVEELVGFVDDAPVIQEKPKQRNIFDEDEVVTRSLAPEKAQLSNYVKGKLSDDARLFSMVKRQGARLEEAGNTLNQSENRRIAEQAKEAQAVYTRLKGMSGPISRALDQGAIDLANGASENAVRQNVYKTVLEGVQRELGRAEPAGRPDASVGEPASGAVGAGDRPEPVRSDPTIAAEPAARTRTYDEVQSAIDKVEGELEAQGIDPIKLFDPGSFKAEDLPPGYKPMPEKLAELHRERDAIQRREDTEINSGIEDRLTLVMPDAASRKNFAEVISEVKSAPALRGAYQFRGSIWQEMGRIANEAMQFARHELGEIEDQFAEIGAVLGGTPDNPGLQLQLRENPRGHAYPSERVFDRAQEILDAVMEGSAPRIPRPPELSAEKPATAAKAETPAIEEVKAPTAKAAGAASVKPPAAAKSKTAPPPSSKPDRTAMDFVDQQADKQGELYAKKVEAALQWMRDNGQEQSADYKAVVGKLAAAATDSEEGLFFRNRNEALLRIMEESRKRDKAASEMLDDGPKTERPTAMEPRVKNWEAQKGQRKQTEPPPSAKPEPPTPEAKQAFGENLRKQAEASKDRLKAKFRSSKDLTDDVSGELDPETMKDLATVGADFVFRGAVRLGRFTADITKDLGNDVLAAMAKAHGTDVPKLISDIFEKSLDEYEGQQAAFFATPVAESQVSNEPSGTPANAGQTPADAPPKNRSTAPPPGSGGGPKEAPSVPAGEGSIERVPDAGDGVRRGGERDQPVGSRRSNVGGARSSGVRRGTEEPPGEQRPATAEPPKGQRGIIEVRPDLVPEVSLAKVPKDYAKDLKPFQQKGVALAIEAMEDPKRGGFLLADGVGSGKSLQALAVAKHFLDQGDKVVIISKAEVFKFPPRGSRASIENDKPTGTYAAWLDKWKIPSKRFDAKTHQSLEPGQTYFATYENLGDIPVDKNTVLIADEAHSLRALGESARSAVGMEKGKKAKATLFMSATPADKPQHIAYLQRIGILEGQPLLTAVEKLGMTLNQGIGKGGKPYESWAIDPRVGATRVIENFENLFDRMIAAGSMIKREIPMDGYNINVQKVTLPPDAQRVMEKIYDGLDPDGEAQGLKLASILMHQRRQQETYKVQSTVDLAKQEVGEGRKVVIFTSRINKSDVIRRDRVRLPSGEIETIETLIHTSEGTALLLKQALIDGGFSAEKIVELHGAAKDAQGKKMTAQSAMKQFNDGDAEVMVATIESGGTGLNLDDTTGTSPRSLIIMTPPFDATGLIQGLGRIYRLSTQSEARAHILMADTEIDNWNAGVIQSKLKTLGAVVGGEVEDIQIGRFQDVGEEALPEGLGKSVSAKQKAAEREEKKKTAKAPKFSKPFPQPTGPLLEVKDPASKGIRDDFQRQLPRPDDWAQEDRNLPNYIKWAIGKSEWRESDQAYVYDQGIQDANRQKLDRHFDQFMKDEPTRTKSNGRYQEPDAVSGRPAMGKQWVVTSPYGKITVTLNYNSGRRMGNLKVTVDRMDMLPAADWKPGKPIVNSTAQPPGSKWF